MITITFMAVIFLNPQVFLAVGLVKTMVHRRYNMERVPLILRLIAVAVIFVLVYIYKNLL